MDYIKNQEEAIAIVKQMIADGQISQEVAEKYFPELKESEGDEMIRKALIRFHKSTIDVDGIKGDDIVAWLEKQGEKDKLIKELGEYKVKYTQEVLKKHINSMSNKDDERLRKTTIAFLKDFAEQGYENAVECIDWLEKQGEQKPVEVKVVIPKFRVGDEIKTAKEESLTITKIDEKGYWSEDLFICDFDEEIIWDLVEQKPAWSEEDENWLIDAINVCELHGYNETAGWLKNRLKSLKDRVQLEQEWSEEDERSIRDSIFYLKSAKKYFEKDDDILWNERWFNLCIEWLESLYKKLRLQSQWKPSDEQMNSIDCAVRKMKESACYDSELVSLFNDLKKLRGE